jgi:hypothetical protein
MNQHRLKYYPGFVQEWNHSRPVETVKEKEISSPGIVLPQNYSSGIADKIFEDKIADGRLV